MQRTSFTFHEEWRSAIQELPTTIRVEIYDAIIEYGLSGTIPTGMKPMVKIAFGFIKESIDKDTARYEAICRRNQENGRKSKGRPKTKNNPKKPKIPNGLSDEQAEGTKSPETPIDKGSSEEKPSGLFGLPQGDSQETKEAPALPLDEEVPPSTPLEVKPPYIPQEKTNRKRAKFIKPTIEEVRAYILEKGYDIDAEIFWNFYEANGWVQGRQQKPIVNWKACVTTWKKQRNNATAKTYQQPRSDTGHPSNEQAVLDMYANIQQLRELEAAGFDPEVRPF